MAQQSALVSPANQHSQAGLPAAASAGSGPIPGSTALGVLPCNVFEQHIASRLSAKDLVSAMLTCRDWHKAMQLDEAWEPKLQGMPFALLALCLSRIHLLSVSQLKEADSEEKTAQGTLPSASLHVQPMLAVWLPANTAARPAGGHNHNQQTGGTNLQQQQHITVPVPEKGMVIKRRRLAPSSTFASSLQQQMLAVVAHMESTAPGLTLGAPPGLQLHMLKTISLAGDSMMYRIALLASDLAGWLLLWQHTPNVDLGLHA